MGAAPISFTCAKWSAWHDVEAFRQRRAHVVTLTGRTRPNPSHNRGPRSSSLEREYVCSCGHTGWSRHVDLERRARRAVDG